jgi:hypothetical protein
MSGSGRTLNNLVHEALDSEFAENALGNTTQSDLQVGILSEVCDVEKWLVKVDLATAARPQLLEFEKECDEAVGAILEAKSRARLIRIKRQIKAVA